MRSSRLLKVVPIAVVIALVVTACGGGNEGERLALSFTGLEPLANGFHYEGWAIIDGAPVATGKFNINASGEIVDLNGRVIEGGEFSTGIDLRNAGAIVITVEPAGDRDAIPAQTHVVAGSVSGARADLLVGHGAALGDSFAGVAGSYILATPTNGNGTDETSGIWFLDLSSGGPSAGLQLPLLPSGWQYEGWVVINGVPVTTGRFLATDGADLAAPFSGPMDGPPFPGEDFLQNPPSGLTFPTDIRGGTAVISIEPDPDDSPLPFTLKPLVGGIPGDAADHVTYRIGANPASLPVGAAFIR